MLIEFKLFDAAEQKEFHELVKASVDKFNPLGIVKQNIYDLQSSPRGSATHAIVKYWIEN